MFTLRTSTMDLDSWVENKYLLIFEIGEEALHIEGRGQDMSFQVGSTAT
jgi:hypothetical protein